MDEVDDAVHVAPQRRLLPTRVSVRQRIANPTWAEFALTGSGVALWWVSLRSLNLGHMNDYGLYSVIGWDTWVGFALVITGFAISLTRPVLRQRRALCHSLVMIFMLHGLASAAEPTIRFAVTWRHAGIIDYIVQHRSVNPGIDAYFNWPGFFAAGAGLADWAGVPNAIMFAKWVPLVFNLLYLPPLVLIFRATTKDTRLVWLSVWVFYLASWIGQDYMSPQGIAYVLYLGATAILLTRFSGVRVAQGRAWERVTLMLIVIASVEAMVLGHQLTPFALLLVVLVLTITRQLKTAWLATIVFVLILAQVHFPAREYFAGHLGGLLSSIGNLDSAFNSNVNSRVVGSAQHQQVVNLRLAFTAVLWLAAGLGLLLRWREPRYRLVAALWLVPFTLIGLQAYGGEILLRVYLFGLPFAAVLAATSLAALLRLVRRPMRVAVLVSGFLVITVAFVIVRFGNERADYFPPDEVAAVARMYAVAPPRSLIVASAPDLPWRYTDYTDRNYLSVTGTHAWTRLNPNHPVFGPLLQEIEDRAKHLRVPAIYLIFTSTGEAYTGYLGPGNPALLPAFERYIARNGYGRAVVSSPNAVLYRLPLRRPR